MAPTIAAVSIRLPGFSAAKKPRVTPTEMAKVMAANTSFSDGQTRAPISDVTGSRVRKDVPRSRVAVWARYLAKRSASGSSSPISLRMRSITAGSMVRPSSDMPEMKLPGSTLNRMKTSAMTANRVGMTLARRRARTRSISRSSAASMRVPSLRGRRGVYPDVFVVLVGDLGRVGLQPVQPRLVGHHRLVVVEEPHRRLFVEQVVGLAKQVVELGGGCGVRRVSARLVIILVLACRGLAGRVRPV